VGLVCDFVRASYVRRHCRPPPRLGNLPLGLPCHRRRRRPRVAQALLGITV